jgi:hypothetical protein
MTPDLLPALLDDMRVADLKELAEQEGISLRGVRNKPQIIDRLLTDMTSPGLFEMEGRVPAQAPLPQLGPRAPITPIAPRSIYPEPPMQAVDRSSDVLGELIGGTRTQQASAGRTFRPPARQRLANASAAARSRYLSRVGRANRAATMGALKTGGKALGAGALAALPVVGPILSVGASGYLIGEEIGQAQGWLDEDESTIEGSMLAAADAYQNPMMQAAQRAADDRYYDSLSQAADIMEKRNEIEQIVGERHQFLASVAMDPNASLDIDSVKKLVDSGAL